LVGRRLIYKYFPERVHSWSLTVERHRDNLLNYIIFLRVTPFLPNWFINITSPVLGVPIVPFFVGTFIGVAPPSFVAIQAGTTLNKLTSSSDAVSWTSGIILIVLGGVSLIPVLLKNRLKAKFDKSDWWNIILRGIIIKITPWLIACEWKLDHYFSFKLL